MAKKTQGDGYRRTAASEATLSGGGLHTARFTVRKGSDMMFGVIGADWDVKGGNDAQEVLGHCFYHTGDGPRQQRLDGHARLQGGRVRCSRLGALKP